MAGKRRSSPQLVGNPFIKKRNLEWTIDPGPPRGHDERSSFEKPHGQTPGAPEVEAGKVKIEDHLSYFSRHLADATISPFPSNTQKLSIDSYKRLYEINAGSPRGAHFIVHQHDHPIAGTHYDLRVQINETSSASWAIMYGLPGDPNSQRLNRNATETRIHCLWNHLIETASASTGSLIVWDTGTYTVLPRGKKKGANFNSQSEEDSSPELTEQQKLHQAFHERKIRLQLNGSRLPHNYVLNLRLTKEEDATGRAKSTHTPMRRRRRGASLSSRGRITRSGEGKAAEPDTSSDPDSDSELGNRARGTGTGTEDDEDEIVNPPAEQADGCKEISPMEREIRELEDEEVRRTNSYPSATNSIGSVHQRRWYLSLDREACGFVRRRREGHVTWELGSNEDNEEHNNRLTFPFYVRGVDVERSVVTGRTGADVLRDEGVAGYVGRKGWRPVLN